MNRLVTRFTALALLLLGSSSAIAVDNFDLTRVDDDVQSTGPTTAGGGVNASVPPFAVTDSGHLPADTGETGAINATSADAALGGGEFELLLEVFAEQLTPWAMSTLVAEAEIGYGVILDAKAPPTGSTAAGWGVGSELDPLMATGDFEVQPIIGHPEITDGILSGLFSVYVNAEITGTLRKYGQSKWIHMEAGFSNLHLVRNGSNNGWFIEGDLFDETGDSEDVFDFLPDDVNEIYPIAQPCHVDDVLHLETSAFIDAGTNGQLQLGAQSQGIWDLSILASFEVEVAP